MGSAPPRSSEAGSSHFTQQNIRIAQRRLAGEEGDHLDAAGEVAVAVVVERAVVVDDAVIGIERSRSDDELVGDTVVPAAPVNAVNAQLVAA